MVSSHRQRPDSTQFRRRLMFNETASPGAQASACCPMPPGRLSLSGLSAYAYPVPTERERGVAIQHSRGS